MGHAARAYTAEPQHEQHAAPKYPERVQPELGRGKVDRDRLVPWLRGSAIPIPRGRGRYYPSASRLFSPAERDVLGDLVASCSYESGRCEKSVAAIAKDAGRDASTVRKVIGGAGYQTDVDRFGNALSPLVQEGSLAELVEHVWYSPNKAQREFTREHPHRKKGLAVNWLRFTTVQELVDWGLERQRQRRRARRDAARRAAAARSLNLEHSAPTPRPEEDAAPSPAARRAPTEQPPIANDAAPSAPVAEQVEHSKTRLSGSLPENLTPPPPPFSLSSHAETEQDDRACGASRPPAGSGVSPATFEAPSPSAPTSTESIEDGGARDVPRAPPPLAGDVASRLAAIAETFVRELAANGRTIQREPAILATITSRYRLGSRLEELEAAAYGAARCRYVLRSAEIPWAIAFRPANVERYAHAGWALRDAAIAERLAREAAAAARTLERPKASELARELADGEPAEDVGDVVVRPVAEVIRQGAHEFAPVMSRAEQLRALEEFDEGGPRRC